MVIFFVFKFRKSFALQTLFGARYYDAEIGFFTSKDPMDEFWNAYAYGPGNPINGVDPNGLEWYVDETGHMLAGPPLSYEDQSVHLGYGGPKIGELGGVIDISIPFQNLIDQNFDFAGAIVNPFTFKELVQAGGDWDLKNNPNYIYSWKAAPYTSQTFSFNGQIMENQDVGNFHYGAVGQNLWFASRKTLLQQAGKAQIRDGTSRPEWQRNGSNYPPYGDDPRDQGWIIQGFGNTYGR